MTRSSSPAHDCAREFPGMIGYFRAAPNSGPTSKSLPGPQFSFGLDLVTNENKITPKRTNVLRIYLLNCCFGLNKNDDFDNYESTISGEPYMWRNQDDHWDVTLDFNLCGTAPWTDIHHQLFIYLFYLFYLNHYLNHWWVIVTGELLQFSSQALTLQIFNILWNVKSDA